MAKMANTQSKHWVSTDIHKCDDTLNKQNVYIKDLEYGCVLHNNYQKLTRKHRLQQDMALFGMYIIIFLYLYYYTCNHSVFVS